MADFHDDDYDDGWCLICGDDFRYDDCGGPCSCGLHCRACHEFASDGDDYDGYDDDEDLYAAPPQENA